MFCNPCLYSFVCFSSRPLLLCKPPLKKLRKQFSLFSTNSPPYYLYSIPLEGFQFPISFTVLIFTFHHGTKKSDDVVWKMRQLQTSRRYQCRDVPPSACQDAACLLQCNTKGSNALLISQSLYTMAISFPLQVSKLIIKFHEISYFLNCKAIFM